MWFWTVIGVLVVVLLVVLINRGPRSNCAVTRHVKNVKIAVSRKEDMANAALVKNLVRGMDLDVDSATAKSEYKGQAYCFCCQSYKT